MTPSTWDTRVFLNPDCAVVQQAAILVLLAAICALIPAVACGWRLRGGATVMRVAGLVIITLAVAVGWWNWPVADDWAWASASRAHGAIGVVVASYGGWTGRFGTYILQSWYGSWCDPLLGSILWSWLLILGTIAAASFALRPYLTRHQAGSVAVLGMAVWIVAMEWPAHGLYWFCATATYAVAIPGVLVLLGLVARMERTHSGWHLAAAGALGLLLGGIGETMSAALAALAVAVAVRAWLQVSAGRWIWTMVAASLMAGLLLNGLAPGTLDRMAAISTTVGTFGGAVHLSPGDMLVQWCEKSLQAGWAWLTHPVVVGAAMAAAPCAGLVARRLGWGAARAWEVPLSWMALPLTVGAAYLPAMVSLGHAPPWRGRDAVQGILLVIGFLALARTVGWLRAHGVGVRRSAVWIGVVLLSLAIIGRIAAGDLRLGAGLGVEAGLLLLCATAMWRWRELSRSVSSWILVALLLSGGLAPSLVMDAVLYGPRWDAVQALQDASLQQTPRGGRGVVIRMSQVSAPRSLWNYGPGINPSGWINAAVAGWYDLESMTVYPEPLTP